MRWALDAALLALLAGAPGCCRCAASPDFALRPATPGPAPAPLAASVRALHFADFGDDTCQQASVAAAMVASHRRAPVDLALSPGDNLYDCGPNPWLPGAEACAFAADGNSVPADYVPPADPLYREQFERLLADLATDAGPVPVYLSLGNHDLGLSAECSHGGQVGQRTRACLEVAHRSPQWIMKGRHYAFDQGPARFLFIDSNLLVGDYGGFTVDGEVEFLAGQAAACSSRPCFLLAHHPAATAGGHRADLGAEYLFRLGRIEQAFAGAGGRIAAWLAGHDHDLQHLRTAGGYDVFVSGNGSRGRGGERFEEVAPPGARLLFASTAWGFGRLEVAPGGWTYRFENDRGEALHCCAAAGGGPCEPVVCR